MSLTKESVKTKAIDLICEYICTPLSKFDESVLDKGFGEIGLDSLDEIELVMEAEDYFVIDIPDEDLENIDTPNKFIDYLYKELDL